VNRGSDQPSTKHRKQILSRKFFQAKDDLKGSHPHIVEWFDSTKNREVKSEIINNCFQQSDGKWKLNPLGPFFKESKQRCVCEITMGAYIALGLQSYREFLTLGILRTVLTLSVTVCHTHAL
jgi:hypothetical protein